MPSNSPFGRSAASHSFWRNNTRTKDAGLRRYMLPVYIFMAAGLSVTGLVAYAAAASGLHQKIAGTPLIWMVVPAPWRSSLSWAFASTV